jgi:hypothetical protein
MGNEGEIMSSEQKVTCPHCGKDMKKWRNPDDSTWITEFQWVCFNDECSYFVKGWDHMMATQSVKASYRCRINPENHKDGPLPCWSHDAHKDRIIEE